MSNETIDFAVWYSGMEREKVERAYARYKREILDWDPELAKQPFPKTDFEKDNYGFEIINPLDHEQSK